MRLQGNFTYTPFQLSRGGGLPDISQDFEGDGESEGE
jgi:hypothetical protein